MIFPLSFEDISLFIAVTSIILLMTSEFLSPRFGKINVLIDKKKLRNVAIAVTILFLITLVIRVVAMIFNFQEKEQLKNCSIIKCQLYLKVDSESIDNGGRIMKKAIGLSGLLILVDGTSIKIPSGPYFLTAASTTTCIVFAIWCVSLLGTTTYFGTLFGTE